LKSIALAALILTVGTAAEAQTVISRQLKSQPVETVVTRQPNGTLTTSSRIMSSQQAAMRTPQKLVKAPVAKPQTKVVYRTIVREVVRQPEPQMVVVREPVTRWMPSILPPFSYPVTSYEDRVVYTTQTYATPTTYTTTYSNPTYATLATSHPRPIVRTVVDDEDESPVVRAYAPASYVIRY
jgi:hypothetical protein